MNCEADYLDAGESATSSDTPIEKTLDDIFPKPPFSL